MPIVLQDLLSSSLLKDVTVFDVHEGNLKHESDSSLSGVAARAVGSGSPELLAGEPLQHEFGDQPFGAVMAVPVYRGDSVVSVVVLAIAPKSEGAGVFELWTPVGEYGEVGLSNGYFAHLERFSNVSSFVRFEYGLGLPGQVWSGGRPVIHDNLPDHPGFLRAAGASAGLLQTAIGIPVMCGQRLQAVATLISAAATPLAKGYEVWDFRENEFVLGDAAFQGLAPELQMEVGTAIDKDHGLAGLALEHQGAITCQNDSFLFAGRGDKVDSAQLSGGLAIPVFSADHLSSVLVLLF